MYSSSDNSRPGYQPLLGGGGGAQINLFDNGLVKLPTGGAAADPDGEANNDVLANSLQQTGLSVEQHSVRNDSLLRTSGRGAHPRQALAPSSRAPFLQQQQQQQNAHEVDASDSFGSRSHTDLGKRASGTMGGSDSPVASHSPARSVDDPLRSLFVPLSVNSTPEGSSANPLRKASECYTPDRT